MMPERIAHIAIAVKDLEGAKRLFSKLLGVEAHHEEVVDGQHVRAAMFRVGEVNIELLQGTDDTSPVTKFIAKRGEGVHHISLEVRDIEAELARLSKEGFELVHDRPQQGADNSRVAFLHPRSTQGVLIEITEHAPHRGG